MPCLAAFLLSFTLCIHRDSIPPLRARFAADSVLRPTPTLMRVPVFIRCPMFPFHCQDRHFVFSIIASSSALLLRARLLQLGFQLHREVVARVVVVPALLPQVRRGGLRADFLFLGPVCCHVLLAFWIL